MSKYKNITALFFLACLFILLNSVSAADYYVNNDTTHTNITDWMKNNANSGDKLIFNTTTYELSNKIVVNKSVKIVSYKNTQVNFRKQDIMFDVKKNTSFTGLTLNRYTENKTVIYSNSKNYIKIDLKNTNINTGNYSIAISINKWIGTINNCNIYSNSSFGIDAIHAKLNIINSKVNSKGYSISTSTWKGDVINSTIISRDEGPAIKCEKWEGKIIGSEIYSNKNAYPDATVYLGLSKGTIKNCVIKSNDSYDLKVTDNVKIIKSSISSKKIHRFKSDLGLVVSPIDYNAYYLPKKGSYKVTIYNYGYKSSPSCYLSFKTMKISKKYYVKSLKPGAKTVIKIAFDPYYMSPYMNIQYPKVFKVDCYNKIKEEDKYNNQFTIDKYMYIDP